MENTVSNAESIVGVLRSRAQSDLGDRGAFAFLGDGENVSGSLTYAELDARVGALAAYLASQLPRGARALLVYPQGLDFIVAFYACLAAGIVAVPVYPPSRSHFAAKAQRLASIAASAGTRTLLTTGAYLAEYEAAFRNQPEFVVADLIATDGVGSGSAAVPVEPNGDEVAFLQFTSGSTSEPKGVVVRHRNLLANAGTIRSAFELNTQSRIVSWLPFYHDMGLIGKLVTPIFAGASTWLMSPAQFVERPARWLQAMSRFRAHVCAAPNSAFDLCLRTIADSEIDGLDLREWRIALNGAEPVRHATMHAFAERFARVGFRQKPSDRGMALRKRLCLFAVADFVKIRFE